MIYYLTNFFYILLGNGAEMPSFEGWNPWAPFDLVGGLLGFFRNGCMGDDLSFTAYWANIGGVDLALVLSEVLAVVACIAFVWLIWKIFKYIFTFGR